MLFGVLSFGRAVEVVLVLTAPTHPTGCPGISAPRARRSEVHAPIAVFDSV